MRLHVSPRQWTYPLAVSDSSFPRPDGRHSRRDATRIQLQTAAVDLFVEQGYGATSTAQIAQHAGVSERTLFRVFATKAGLVWHDPFVHRLLAELEAPSGADTSAARALADAVETSVQRLSDEEWLLNVHRRQIALSEPDLIAVGTLDLARTGRRLAAVLGAPAPEDEGDTQQPSGLSLFSWFSLVGFTQVPLTAETQRDEWARALIRVVDLAAHGALVRRL